MPEEVDAHVLRKYELVERLGKGAYGVVWKAVEKANGQTVALKKIFAAFQNVTDAQRTFREIMFLLELSDAPNVIRLSNVLKAENDHDIYLVFEFMETDLHRVICANILEDIHIQFTMHQLFKSLNYIHSAGMIHRDLKPSNVLLDRKCNLKVADFGLARSVAQLEPDTSPIMTDYVATRWYRAPEMLLGSTKYTYGVDMWSAGCILGELLGGKPLFRGDSTKEQLDLLLAFTGRPSDQDVDSIQSRFASMLIDAMPDCRKTELQEVYPTASDDALDLLERLLVFNPSKRITAEEALRHPYIGKFYQLEDTPVCPRIIHIPISDDKRQSVAEYRNTLYAAIVGHKKELRQRNLEQRHEEVEHRPSVAEVAASSDFEQRVTERDGVRAKAHTGSFDTRHHSTSSESVSGGSPVDSRVDSRSIKSSRTKSRMSPRGGTSASTVVGHPVPTNQHLCQPNIGCLEVATCLLAPAMCVWGTWLWLYAQGNSAGQC